MWAAKTSVHEFERACKRINVCAEARSRILPFVHMHERAHIWHNQSAPSQEYLGVHECKQAWLSLILIQCLYTWSVCVRLSLCVCLCAWGKNVGYSHSPPQPPASSSENGEQGCVHQQCAEPCKPGSGLVSLQLLQLLACVTSTYAENKAIRPWPQRTSFRHMPPFPLVLTYKKELSPPWGGGGGQVRQRTAVCCQLYKFGSSWDQSRACCLTIFHDLHTLTCACNQCSYETAEWQNKRVVYNRWGWLCWVHMLKFKVRIINP